MDEPMSNHPKFRDPQYYLYRSEEALTYAELMIDPIARRTMQSIARDYVQMAHMVTQLQKDRENVVPMRREE